MKLINLSLFVLLFTLSACSVNYTIGTQKNYTISATSKENSYQKVEIPVSATVDSTSSNKQEATSDAKATPDALSTGVGAIGSILSN